MHSSKCRNFTETGLLPIKSMNYHSVISLIALFDIHSLSCKYGINGLLYVKLNNMQDLNTLP